MVRYKTRSELKNQAKNILTEKYGPAILLLVLCEFIQMAASMITLGLVPFDNIWGSILSTVLSLLVTIVVNILEIGIALFYLNMACGQPFAVSNLFHGFRENPNKSLGIAAVICGLSFLFGLPVTICELVLGADAYTVNGLILILVIYLICEVIYIPLSLALSQTYYLVLDYPDLGTIDTIKMSMRIMKGHKKRLFVLQLSFLPLTLLCCITCCGIGFLWLNPYMQMTYTCFFLDLMAPAKVS